MRFREIANKRRMNNKLKFLFRRSEIWRNEKKINDDDDGDNRFFSEKYNYLILIKRLYIYFT